MSRIRTKGHYRYVERDELGRFIKVEKWTSKKEQDSNKKEKQ